MKSRREAVIKSWMESVVNNGLDRYQDLHVDVIDKNWSSKEMWVIGAITAFELAVNERNKRRLRSTIAVAFSLKTSFTGDTVMDLVKCLDWSPPSLYLFRPSKEPWRSTDAAPNAVDFSVTDLNGHLAGIPQFATSCYYVQFIQRDTRVRARTIFLAAERTRKRTS